MNSKSFTFNSKDLVHSLANAVFAGVILGLGSVVSQNGFDIFSANWGDILHTVVNAAFAAFVGSMGINTVANSEGKVFGMAVK